MQPLPLPMSFESLPMYNVALSNPVNPQTPSTTSPCASPHEFVMISPTASANDDEYKFRTLRQSKYDKYDTDDPSNAVYTVDVHCMPYSLVRDRLTHVSGYSFTPIDPLTHLMGFSRTNLNATNAAPFKPVSLPSVPLSLDQSKSFTTAIHPTRNTIQASMIHPCPNMVNLKCRCKHILRQNIAAQKIWSSCCRMNVHNEFEFLDDRELDVAYDGLYAKLCEYWKSEVNSSRTPKEAEISEAIKCFGGFAHANELCIDRCNFLAFWKWFRGAAAIVKDLHTVWDTKFPFQMNLFMDRDTCHTLLGGTPQGTFILRVSQSQPNGLVLSYSEPTFNRARNIRQILLIRTSKQNYVTKTNRNSNRSSSLNQLIRTFVKLKFVYSPNYIYKKNQVF